MILVVKFDRLQGCVIAGLTRNPLRLANFMGIRVKPGMTDDSLVNLNISYHQYILNSKWVTILKMYPRMISVRGVRRLQGKKR